MQGLQFIPADEAIDIKRCIGAKITHPDKTHIGLGGKMHDIVHRRLLLHLGAHLGTFDNYRDRQWIVRRAGAIRQIGDRIIETCSPVMGNGPDKDTIL